MADLLKHTEQTIDRALFGTDGEKISLATLMCIIESVMREQNFSKEECKVIWDAHIKLDDLDEFSFFIS